MSLRAQQRTEPTLEVEYSALADLQRQPALWWRDVLAVVHFDRAAVSAPLSALSASDAPADVPAPEIMMSVLGGGHGRAEIWRLPGPLSGGRRGRVRYRRNGRLLFASLCVSAAQCAATGSGAAARLRADTEAAYTELFGVLEDLGFPHPLRIWNYLPQINGAAGGAERYWHFNGARQDAFLSARRSIAGDVPAASALGTEPGSSLVIYCIAGVRPPIALENPRQCSVWQYPSQYGPRSPTFARACIDGDTAQTLFISGTASIVGHETAHAGDAVAQTREIVSNIRALIGAANERIGCARYATERLHYKVYVRRAEDQPRIEQALCGEIGPEPPVLFLRADICRRDLLVEIEAVSR